MVDWKDIANERLTIAIAMITAIPNAIPKNVREVRSRCAIAWRHEIVRKSLGLPEYEAVQEVAVWAVLRWLQAHPGWLLILDNVDDDATAAAVRDLLPELRQGHVLVTSRLSNWPPILGAQELDVLSPPAATAFLLRRTDGHRLPIPDDEARAAELADLLGRLPLALEQAGAYVAFHRLGLTEYLEAWQGEKAKVLEWYDDRVMLYPEALAATWQHSFEHLGPAAQAILRLAAFLAPEPIPEEIFDADEEALATAVAAAAEPGDPPGQIDVRSALGELLHHSLIHRQHLPGPGAAFTVHRMVQEVVRGRVPEEERGRWVGWSVQLVEAYSPFDADDVRTWPVWDALRPHAEEVIRQAEVTAVASEAATLMNQLGLLLKSKALHAQAEPLFRRALRLDEAAHGESHPTVAIQLNNLAQLLKATNRLSEAEPLMRRALLIDESSHGESHPDVARDLNNLAQLLQDTNRLSEAEPLMRRALAIDESSYGESHPDVAGDLNNLAGLLQATNRLAEAEPLLRRALAIDESSYGESHPAVARDLNNLARLLQVTNRLVEAEPLMRRSLAIFKASLGDNHPRTQIVQANLDDLLAKLKAADP